ncbi:glycosyltransferase family 2 protein [Staphylococcus delphini]|uniref:glycosyltransferase family 2 protein n=1 Tax=Staphylococcus delphini TaxID=53344 RepID=UPI0023B320C7|nr:glycosyltransferase family 2 protein [Staphylococcus delphini]MDE9752869.1 glycosyltransferase family 2 protein [Staphylococcus delphini]MDE9790250.1 glycosyltransferase family 2 protein [Staphylococcus delphini]MDE9791845.1 glycosyltransferase family 2 protein [Staphylococcus delphini]MDE9794391.1 glycosyltransferase family 2 protein [Staphylococcus delphini]MDE9797461.1 glycosyltransferase family 2 protein [Staphylococcus delphini]
MGPLVSIIISVYNKGDYIQKCLESITKLQMEQSQLEVIIVDDKSTDDSVAKIKPFIDEYPYIHLIELESNTGGPSEPRNIGMREAKGRYLTLLDADDWLDEQGFPLLVEKVVAHDDDIGFGQILKHTNDSVEKVALFASYQEAKHLVPYELVNIFRSVGPPGKVFKKEVVEQLGLQFEHRQYGEDKRFFAELIGKAKTATMTEATVYHTNRYQENVSLVKTTSVYEKAVINLDILKEVVTLDIPEVAMKGLLSRFIELDFMRRMFQTKTFANSGDQAEYYDVFNEMIEVIASRGYDVADLLTMDTYQKMYDVYQKNDIQLFEAFIDALVLEPSHKRLIEDGQVYRTLDIEDERYQYLPIECYPVYQGTHHFNGKPFEVIHVLKDQKTEIRDVKAVEIQNAMNEQALDFEMDQNQILIPTQALDDMEDVGINIKVRFNDYKEALVYASYPSNQPGRTMKRQNFKLELVKQTKRAASQKANYFNTLPEHVVTVKKVKLYEDADFNIPMKEIEAGTPFNIESIERSSKGTPRLKTTEGSFITANQKFVEILNDVDKEKYYTMAPKEVEIIKNCQLYDSRSFKRAPIRKLKAGEMLAIDEVIYTKNQTPRLKTTEGYYVTANKKFVVQN